jgi:hypothetical protein
MRWGGIMTAAAQAGPAGHPDGNLELARTREQVS